MKYAIHWGHTKVDSTYLMDVEFKSRHTDTYKIVLYTELLSEAPLFDTRESAEKFVETKLHDTFRNRWHITEITDKELFKAKLAEE